MTEPHTGADKAELERAFLAELAAVNLQRLFWLLWAGLANRVIVLAVNRWSASPSDVLDSMQWFDLIVIPPLIVMTWRLRRPRAMGPSNDAIGARRLREGVGALASPSEPS